MLCAPSGLCPLLLLLVTEAAWSTAAVALESRNRLDPLHPSRAGRDLYQVQDTDLYCKKCPPGTHVSEPCKEPYGFSSCIPCNDSKFTEYPNDFLKCLGCRICREDQVELSPCRADRNRQCVCKNGTFCSRDHPCEMCQKCRRQCPKGEVELAPCTPHSDRQCGPPSGASSAASNNVLVMAGVVAAVAVITVVLVFVLWKRRCCQSRGDGRDLSGKSCSVMDYLVRQLTRYRGGGPGTQDNTHNEQLCRNHLLSRTSSGVTPSSQGPEVMVPSTSVMPRRNLVPVPGRDPSNLLRRSFDIFAQVVPLKDWKRYGRALDLLENDMDLAEKNDRYSQEAFFQMLNTWHNKQGMNASINTLLQTLHQISLGGIAEDISTKLVQQGFYQYEVS